MTLDSINIHDAVAAAEKQLAADPHLSPALRSTFALLLVVVKLLMARLNMNSRNSSKPPSTDPNRERKKRTPGKRKPGGQPQHIGTTLAPVEQPDEIRPLKLDRRRLPRGAYHAVGTENRQVVELAITRKVIEYQAEVLENECGQRFVAPFPAGITRPIQYGASVKANAVALSMFQLLPYERVQTHFAESYQLPISTGSLCNFNAEAYDRLQQFEALAKRQLASAAVLHADETGINIGGKGHWLHNASSPFWTLYLPHAKRGREAMDEIDVLPRFRGTLIHDHWKPYYTLDCTHALCNAHHLRELTHAHEEDGQKWAGKMHTLLLAINEAIQEAGGALSPQQAAQWRQKYRCLLRAADKECPPPAMPDGPPKRGRVKRSKSRNLLERLRDYEADVLRFMEEPDVPFTNNQGERDIRMTKVQQKISGCFRSIEGARIFCRIRSYLSTCRKHDVAVGEALAMLFADQWPEFIQKLMDDER